MNIYKMFVLLVLLAGTNLANGQTLKQYLKGADEAFANADYGSALQWYGIATEITENRSDIWYKLAESARMIDYYELADSAYQRVLDLDDPAKHAESTFWQASMKKALGQYDEAATLFNQYAGMSGTTPEYIELATMEAEDCYRAIGIVEVPLDDVALDTSLIGINTPDSEFGAFWYNDQIYYTSYSFIKEDDEHYPPRPYMKVMQSEALDQAGTLYVPINHDTMHTAYPTYNSDGSRVYFAQCAYVGVAGLDCSLYYREVLDDDGNLGHATRLPEQINKAGSSNTMPQIGVDEETGSEVLFFVSDREEGSAGGNDIWCSVINADGTFSTPENIAAVNSEKDEVTPFFHSGTQTLYYSSKGFQSIGGFDVFSAVKEGSNWQDPVALGYPVNTSFNEVSFNIDEAEKKGLFASNRRNGQPYEAGSDYCCYDIYSYRKLTLDLEIFVFDAKTRQPLPGSTVHIDQLIPGKKDKMLLTESNPDGNDFYYSPELGFGYLITADREGYVTSSEIVDVSLTMNPEEPLIRVDVYLPPNIIDLTALIYDRDFPTDPLLGTTVQLLEFDDQIAIETKDSTNRYDYNLKRTRTYTLIASKPGYHSDTLIIDLEALGNPMTLERKIYLRVKDLIDFPPLYLYFDNDEPDPKTFRKTTQQTYGQSFDKYYSRKDKFIDEYTKVLEGRDRFLAEQLMRAFFEREIRDGFENLEVFSSRMMFYLERGVAVKVTVTGFTSPRASTEYNEALGARRVASLMNHFNKFQDGILVPYLRNGLLQIEEVSVGESKAPTVVSDRLNDERNSIYSPIASAERRVEIIGVTIDE
ncbi:MAG: hypothetical protein KDC34_04455 [Saprospiraceae bacterium]|nr:hypothetical protein [Saprospiraceae bacterium]